MPIVVLAIVATPFVFTAWVINRILGHRRAMRGLVAATGDLRALSAARDDLEERVRVLEAIVTSQDYELNRRLRHAG